MPQHALHGRVETELSGDSADGPLFGAAEPHELRLGSLEIMPGPHRGGPRGTRGARRDGRSRGARSGDHRQTVAKPSEPGSMIVAIGTTQQGPAKPVPPWRGHLPSSLGFAFVHTLGCNHLRRLRPIDRASPSADVRFRTVCRTTRALKKTRKGTGGSRRSLDRVGPRVVALEPAQDASDGSSPQFFRALGTTSRRSHQTPEAPQRRAWDRRSETA